ncbi:hypothetical protein ES703_122433 [subsurface metagenome]
MNPGIVIVNTPFLHIFPDIDKNVHPGPETCGRCPNLKPRVVKGDYHGHGCHGSGKSRQADGANRYTARPGRSKAWRLPAQSLGKPAFPAAPLSSAILIWTSIPGSDDQILYVICQLEHLIPILP